MPWTDYRTWVIHSVECPTLWICPLPSLWCHLVSSVSSCLSCLWMWALMAWFGQLFWQGNDIGSHMTHVISHPQAHDITLSVRVMLNRAEGPGSGSPGLVFYLKFFTSPSSYRSLIGDWSFEAIISLEVAKGCFKQFINFSHVLSSFHKVIFSQ